MPRKDAGPGPISAQVQQEKVSEGIENFELPKTIVQKIAKSVMPPGAMLQKETIISLIKGSTVFINYLAATAHDVAISKQHKCISASDVLRALEILEFGDIATKLNGELSVYRDLTKNDKNRKNSINTGSASAPIKSKTTSSSSKGKGKERAEVNQGPPFTSTPLPLDRRHDGELASSASRMDIDETQESNEPSTKVDIDEDVVMDDAVEHDENEGLIDNFAIEEDELQRDARGLEDHPEH